MAKILIIGCGAIGSKLATILSENNHMVVGLKRIPPVQKPDKWVFFSADIAIEKQLEELSTDFDQVFFIISPEKRNEQSYQKIYRAGLNNLIRRFAKDNRKPHWIFVSSTCVYHQSDGEWVDENSLVEPISNTSKLIREAEQTLLANLPESTIVRFSGIYGPERRRLIKIANSSPSIQYHPDYYTNRIHEQDCVAVLQFLSQQQLNGVHLENYYLASDDKPATQWEVISWLADKMQAKPPVMKMGDETASMNKRCNNQRLKALGYEFKFPSYKEGYSKILD